MTALKISVVLGAGLVLAAMMRRQSAAARHWVLAVTIVSAGLLPLCELVAPAWGFSLATPAWTLPLLSGKSLTAAIVSSEREIARAMWLWLAGATIAFSSLLAGFARLAWIAARARRDVDAEWIALVVEISRDLGITRPIHVLASDMPAMPMTWGLSRPRILLPSSARAWTRDRLRAVFSHELAHVQRGDWTTQIVAELVACVYWFHPLVWIASRRLRLESDRACDDAVLTLGVNGSDYAAQLVGVARAVRAERATWRAAAALARRGDLARRVAAALNDRLDRSPSSPAASCAIVATILAVTLPIAGFTLTPTAVPPATSLSDVQRNIMLRLGGEERRLSIAARDISFWKNRIEGRVELHARLGVDGSLTGIRFVEPVHPDLATAAASIVRQWRPEPARVRGVPVEVPIRMTVDFTR